MFDYATTPQPLGGLSDMPSESDDAYHARRAQQELDLAASAIDPEVKGLHLNMAARYAAMRENRVPNS